MKQRYLILFILSLGLYLCFFSPVSAEDRFATEDKEEIPQSLQKLVSLNLQNVSLGEALTLLSKTGEFKLNYNRYRIPVNKKISLNLDKVPAVEALERILKDTGAELWVTPWGQLAIIPSHKKVPPESHRLEGKFQGRVYDDRNGEPIPGVSIELQGMDHTAYTNSRGFFNLGAVSPGEYSAAFNCYGFDSFHLPSITIQDGQVTDVQVKMDVKPIEVEAEAVDVFGNLKVSKNPLSAFSLTANDFQGAPESSGGVSRMLQTFPGISFISDTNLDYVIRGGNPLENSFYIDNIEVPSIDHIHTLGSQGGFFSSLNPNLIQNIDFLSGCFSSDYGDRLSSVTRVSLREGNRERFAGIADFSLAGAGGHFEGPFADKRGSWILSLRRSHLEFVQAVGADLDTVPQTLDSQVKFTYDLSPRHKLNFLNYYAGGKFRERDPSVQFVTNMLQVQNTTGLNWTSNWSQSFFSSTSVSFNYRKRNDGELYNTGYIDPSIWNWKESAESFNLRNSNFLILHDNHKLDFGLQVKHESAVMEYRIDKPLYDYFGNTMPACRLARSYRTTKYSLFSSYLAELWQSLNLSIGLRGDYSTTQSSFSLSPRLSLTYHFSRNFAINGGMGIFYQSVPMNYLAFLPQATELKDMKATHYVLGIEYISDTGIICSLEAYSKQYDHLPISLDAPLNLLTDLTLDYSADNYFPGHILPTHIVDSGTALSRGIEFLFQKRWLSNFSTVLSLSYFQSVYTDLYGVARSRVFDSQYIANLFLKYRLHRKWEVSARWTSMGGAPYTPMDLKKTMAADTLILDDTQFLSHRYPGYNRANVRVSRLIFSQNKTIYLYFEIWNFFNQRLEHHLGVIPLLGIKYQF